MVSWAALPPTQRHTQPNQNHIPGAIVKDMAWLKHLADIVDQGKLHDTLPVSWSGFNSHLQQDLQPKGIIGICPLFRGKAATGSMM